MGMLKKVSISMISALILCAIIANVSGVCEDDLVPLKGQVLPAEWNIGTIPHLFLDSEHLRGVMSCSNLKVIGLDTVVPNLYFCPPTMTIYGNLTARSIRIVGGYTGNLDYLKKGQDTFAHGKGDMDLTVENLEMNNMELPIRYSTIVKKLQIDEMQYEVNDTIFNPIITGFETDHVLTGEEFVRLDKGNSLPTFVELLKSVINMKVKKGILLGVAKTLFASAVVA